MYHNPNAYSALPIGVVVRRSPGVTRWQPWTYTVCGVLPGAAPADWRELRKVGDITELHADTVPLELHGAETEAYLHELGAQLPCLYIVMRPGLGVAPYDVLVVTASPYEAQDYTESGEEIVEKVPMPQAVLDHVRAFVARHHEEEAFVKRKRDKKRIDAVQDGIGDPRVDKAADIYASPSLIRRRVQ